MSESAIFDPTTGEVLGGRVGDAPPPRLERADEDAPAEVTQEPDAESRLEAYQRLVEGLQVDVTKLEQDVKAKNRKIKSLEDELKEQRQEAPEAQTVRAIFNSWVLATGRPVKRTKLGPTREKAVLARLREGHDPERVMRAATIGVKGAHVSNKDAEREALIAAMHQAVGLLSDEDAATVRRAYKAALGKGTKVYDDLELICRDEVHLEKFADLADKFDPPGGEAV